MDFVLTRPEALAAVSSFGDRLRILRQAAHLTQDDLAELAGLSTNGVSALERGTRRRPHPHTVRSLAEALRLSSTERDWLTAPLRDVGSAAAAGGDRAGARPARARLGDPGLRCLHGRIGGAAPDAGAAAGDGQLR